MIKMMWLHIFYILLTTVLSIFSLFLFHFPSLPSFVALVLLGLGIQEGLWVKEVVDKEIKEAKQIIREIYENRDETK